MDLSRNADGRYYENKNDGMYDVEYKTRALSYILLLEEFAKRYYQGKPRTEITYEDLYYLAAQIREDIWGNWENPAIYPLLKDLRERCQHILESKAGDLGEWDFTRLVEEGRIYIVHAVRICLSKTITDLSSYRLIGEIPWSKHDIFTLNHDLLLEECMIGNGMIFEDGFSEPINGVRWWEPEKYLVNAKPVRLFKLHGSINWYSLRRRSTDSLETPAIVLDDDVDHAINLSGHREFASREPIILAGTLNKLAEYSSGVFADMYFHFRRSINEAKSIVICGYGFGDKGVNTEILQKAYASTDTKILVITPNVNMLKQNARPAIRRAWPELEAMGRLAIVEKRFEDATWLEVAEKLTET